MKFEIKDNGEDVLITIRDKQLRYDSYEWELLQEVFEQLALNQLSEKELELVELDRLQMKYGSN